MSELYVYWRVASARADGAARAAGAFQRGQCAVHAGLQARLLRRNDAAAGHATLMEVYAHPGGIDAALQASIVDAGARALGGWAEGGRHVEVFTPAAP